MSLFVMQTSLTCMRLCRCAQTPCILTAEETKSLKRNLVKEDNYYPYGMTDQDLGEGVRLWG